MFSYVVFSSLSFLLPFMSSQCPAWASAGYCMRTHVDWMATNCPKACNKCPCTNQYRSLSNFSLFQTFHERDLFDLFFLFV